MEIRKGYKQTEVGVIPENWEIKSIGQIATIQVGRDLKLNHFSNLQDDKFKYPVFSNTVSNYGLYGFYDIYEYVGESLTIVGRGVGLGTAFARTGGYGAIGRLLILFPTNDVDYRYITDYINHRIKIFSESGGIPQLTGISIAKYRMPLPPTKSEQTAIATALSDADSLISSLEKLIEKKKAIKQGAMQELLKPKEGWVEKKLGEIVKISRGHLITDKTRTFGNIPVIAGGKTPAYFHNKANRIGKTITISSSGASAGYVSFHNNPIFASDCSTIEESKDYSIEFVFYLLLLFQENIYKMQTGGAQPHIHPNDLNPIEFSFPKKEVQVQIAKILSEMDTEIIALKTKLDKNKMIKQAMMQNLLTGKIRLV